MPSIIINSDYQGDVLQLDETSTGLGLGLQAHHGDGIDTDLEPSAAMRLLDWVNSTPEAITDVWTGYGAGATVRVTLDRRAIIEVDDSDGSYGVRIIIERAELAEGLRLLKIGEGA